MSEAHQVCERDSDRTLAIVAHALFLAGIPTAHLAAIGAVIIAYVQRDAVRGTIWESHFEAVITTFWTALVIFLVAIPLCFVLVGIPILIGLGIWVLYRAIRGLVHAAQDRPY
jgi:uncharacterized membrane protein